MAEGAQVRTVVIAGSPWFVANDVAAVLELVNVRSSLALLDGDEKGVHAVDTPGGLQEVTVISEAGLYSLVSGVLGFVGEVINENHAPPLVERGMSTCGRTCCRA